MKFTFLINQAGVVDAGLERKTDFSDWAILEYLSNWQLTSQAVVLDGHCWLSLKSILKEMPMLSVRTKSGVSGRIKRLRELGLITTLFDDDGRLFAKVTDYYCGIMMFRGEPKQGLHKNGHPVHTDEHPVHTDEHPVHTDEHPVHTGEHPVHTGEHTLNNNILNNKETTTACAYALMGVFVMNLDWAPDQAVLSALLKRAGFDIAKVDQAWLVEFVGYWSDQKGRSYEHERWTSRFASKCIAYFRNPGLFNQHQGVGLTTASNNASAHGAEIPKDDGKLIGWLRAKGLGDGPIGLNYDQLRAWARRQMQKQQVTA